MAQHLPTVEVPRSDRLPVSRSLLVASGVSAVITALCIALIDQPVARWIGQFEPSPLWDRALGVLEWTIGLPIWRLLSAVVVVAAMVACAVVAPWRGHAPAWMFVAGTHLATRLAMIYLKDGTGRLRPSEWLAAGGDTFWRAGGVSFPSGHVVLFAGVAIPIAVLWPRGRAVLAIVGLVMIARVAVDAHFVSDVTGAITLVALVAWLVGYLVRPLLRPLVRPLVRPPGQPIRR